MAPVIERTPDAFATLDEEAIRTHFLLQLNGHYEGNATGETFNAAGTELVQWVAASGSSGLPDDPQRRGLEGR